MGRVVRVVEEAIVAFVEIGELEWDVDQVRREIWRRCDTFLALLIVFPGLADALSVVGRGRNRTAAGAVLHRFRCRRLSSARVQWPGVQLSMA